VFTFPKGWKVANVPVVKDIPLPDQLFTIDQRKVIGLIIDAETLARVRKERLIRMGEDGTGEYAKLDHIVEEIEHCKDIFKRNRRWPVLNVTGKALEETATEVEKFIKKSFPDKV